MARYPLKTDYGVKSNQMAVIADRLLIPMAVRNSRFMYHHDQKKPSRHLLGTLLCE